MKVIVKSNGYSVPVDGKMMDEKAVEIELTTAVQRLINDGSLVMTEPDAGGNKARAAAPPALPAKRKKTAQNKGDKDA
jgi:hypothetical protein